LVLLRAYAVAAGTELELSPPLPAKTRLEKETNVRLGSSTTSRERRRKAALRKGTATVAR
jgi:hypothetical protein